MSNQLNAFAQRTMNSKEGFATALAKLFYGPQGPAAAEIIFNMLADKKSRFAVEFESILNIHLGRMYRDAVLAQLTNPSKESQ